MIVRKRIGSTRAPRLQDVFELRIFANFNFFLPYLSADLDRFHYSKEFPYDYEGETISKVAGASSARSALKIRARCVVKPVAPCQHVLKVRNLYFALTDSLTICHNLLRL